MKNTEEQSSISFACVSQVLIRYYIFYDRINAYRACNVIYIVVSVYILIDKMGMGSCCIYVTGKFDVMNWVVYKI